MTPTLLPIVLAALLSGDPGTADDPAPRKPNPLAPSLPELTADEEAQLDKIIDRFMRFDTGQLPGDEGNQALRDFENLGPEAIPALIRGINRAAVMENSCPTLVIAKKLKTMLMASDDQELLEFAYDEIAAGIERSQHMRILQDLRVMCMLRRNALARQEELTGVKSPHKMTTAELADAASRDSGARLKQEVMELGVRKGPEALTGLIAAAGRGDKDARQTALALIARQFTDQGFEFVEKKLKDDQADVRRAAALSAAKFPSLTGDLIPMLADADPGVADAAHQSLVKLDGGEDLGPASAAKADVAAAQQKWQAWWDKQRGK